MKRWIPFILLLSAASAFAYAPSPKLFSPGAHLLIVSAKHPSGQFTTNASVWFTNSASGGDRVEDLYNSAGLVRRRIWRSADGTATNRTQILYWDAKERLYQLADYDAQQNGYLWLADYDGLDRRIRTRWYVTVNGTTQIYGVTPKTISQYYDPLAEFLELGVTVDNGTTWKIYGPDLKLEAVAPGLGQFQPTITDTRGSVLGVVTNGAIAWTLARVTGYGAVSGYRPLPLGHGGDLVAASAWHGVWADISGMYWRGKRYYDPVSGQWLSSDPVWNGRDPNYYSFCGGDPINFDDPDGRLASKFFNQNPAGVFIGGSANDAANMAGRFIDGSVEATAIGGDMIMQSVASSRGYGAEYQGNSELYQNIYNSPATGPTATGILWRTGEAVVNVGTLGLYGMGQGFGESFATGDFSHAQDASLNALLLSGSARAMQSQGVNPWSFGRGSGTVNLGGEGEVSGGNVINVQPATINASVDQALQNVARVNQVSGGQPVVMAPGNNLPFASGSIRSVVANSVPIDTPARTIFGPSFTSAEIMRIVAPGGSLSGSSMPAALIQAQNMRNAIISVNSIPPLVGTAGQAGHP